jgi:deoxycytidine triphosphate deaminase
MLLAHDEIEELLELEVVEYADKDLINSASLDIRLGMEILVERPLPEWEPKAKPWANTSVINYISTISKTLAPPILSGEFILAHSHEVFNLPNHIQHSMPEEHMARTAHLNAGWCDAGWHALL